MNDDDLSLIVAALRSRAAMTSSLRRHRIERLAERLADLAPGNPRWRIDDASQTQEELLADDQEEETIVRPLRVTRRYLENR